MTSMSEIAACKGGTMIVGSCRYCRAIATANSATTIVDNVFLPSGIWPREEGDNTGGNYQEEQDDLTRFVFLRDLEVLKRVTVRGLGGNYEAFIFKGHSSNKEIALVEKPKTSNALYAFDASHPSWIEAAQLTKWEVVNSVRPPQFIKRFYHTGTFRDRVRTFLVNS